MSKRLSGLRFGSASALMFLAGGGCIALGYDFDKEPPIACTKATDCPGDPVCGTPACEAGVCKVLTPLGAGEAPAGQALGDCKKVTCDGKGNAIISADNMDVLNDGNDCTADLCTEGVAQNPHTEAGSPCGAGGALQCNGVGRCVGCKSNADCGADTICTQWTCDAEICIPTIAMAGTLASNVLPGDCMANLCNEYGLEVERPYKLDPKDDSNDCTVDTCSESGTTEHNTAPNGTVCGTTDCQMCLAGQCGDCDPGNYACEMKVCTLLQKLPQGQSCASNLDCANGLCVDGFCCESDCAGQCMACGKTLTNAENGLCRPLIDGTDPNDECTNPAGDVCVAGKCQCNDKVQNGTETAVDCGGICAPCPGKWVCSGPNGCDSGPDLTCCDPVCFLCFDQTAQCQALHGQLCDIGAGEQAFTLGVVPGNGCFGGGAACESVTCRCL